jgi:hypothetical protein
LETSGFAIASLLKSYLEQPQLDIIPCEAALIFVNSSNAPSATFSSAQGPDVPEEFLAKADKIEPALALTPELAASTNMDHLPGVGRAKLEKLRQLRRKELTHGITSENGRITTRQ